MTTTEKTIVTQGATAPVAIMPTTDKASVSKAAATTPDPVVAVKAAKKAATKRAIKKPMTSPKVAVKAEVKATATPAVKATAKTTAKPAVKAKPKAASNASVKAKDVKTAKLKKPKLVRDSFTIPKAEYTVLDDLKQRAGKLANAVKKSELIRAGVKALAAMSDAAFLSAVKAVPTIKTGRPSKAKVG